MTRKWHITGYAGHSDYDGPEDNNLDFTLEMDESVTKPEIEALLTKRFEKFRSTTLRVTME